MPPTPANLRPGYEAVRYAGGWLVLDQASDLEVLARGLMSLDSESGDPPPSPGDETNSVPELAPYPWLGTWIQGLPSPVDASNGLPISREPMLWTICCTNQGYSQRAHVMSEWTHNWCKVCPGDLVYVQWPIWCATFEQGWPCFLVEQRGTNAMNVLKTNWCVARMDNEDHDKGGMGNWARWTIPAWPADGSTNLMKWVRTNICLWSWQTLTSAICLFDMTNGWQLATNSYTLDTGCFTNFFPDVGPSNVTSFPTTPTGDNPNPQHPIIVQDFPVVTGDAPWYNGQAQGPPWNAGCHYNLTNDFPGVPKSQYWHVAPTHYLTDGVGFTNQSDTNSMVAVATFKVHGLSGQALQLEFSTNGTTWVLEGTNRIIMPDEGVGHVMVVRSNVFALPDQLLFRLKWIE